MAIERDRRAIDALQELAAHHPGRLDVLEADALAIAWDVVPPALFDRADRWAEGGENTRSLGPSLCHGEGRREGPGAAPPASPRIIANLPYNIATALLVRWLVIEPWPPW